MLISVGEANCLRRCGWLVCMPPPERPRVFRFTQIEQVSTGDDPRDHVSGSSFAEYVARLRAAQAKRCDRRVPSNRARASNLADGGRLARAAAKRLCRRGTTSR